MDKDILTELFTKQGDALTESAQATIIEAIDNKVNQLVEERVEIALEQQDKANTEMLQQVVEKYEKLIKEEKNKAVTQLDEKHATLTKEAFDLVEADRTKKLIQVKEHYEQLLAETVKDEVETIAKAIDVFLENFIDQHIPQEIFTEAAERDHSKELLAKISRLITFDKTVTEDVKHKLNETSAIIEEQRKELEKFKLKEFLREKTKNLPVLERKFIIESLKGHDVEYAKRNFDYIKTLFGKTSNKKVVSEKTSYTNIDRPTVVVEEATRVVGEEAEPKTAMAVWVQNAMTNKPF